MKICRGWVPGFTLPLNFLALSTLTLEQIPLTGSDSVVRTNYHKYFHPKECLISNGVLNRAISESAGKSIGYLTGDEGNNTQV